MGKNKSQENANKNAEDFRQMNSLRKSNTLLAVLVAVLATAVIVGGLVWWWKEKEIAAIKEIQKQKLKSLEEVSKQAFEVSQKKEESSAIQVVENTGPEQAEKQVKEKVVAEHANWNIYKNEQYGFQFKYPLIATVKEIKDEDGKNTYSDHICINVSHQQGFITIIPPGREERNLPCGRTGVGAIDIESNRKSDQLTIEGKKYTAKGWDVLDAGAYDYYRSLSAEVGGEEYVILYGITVKEDELDKENAPELMDDLKSIVETLEKI